MKKYWASFPPLDEDKLEALIDRAKKLASMRRNLIVGHNKQQLMLQ